MAKKALPADVRDWFRQQGRRGGHLGGLKAANNMTAAERIARARKGGLASAASKRAKAKQDED